MDSKAQEKIIDVMFGRDSKLSNVKKKKKKRIKKLIFFFGVIILIYQKKIE